jgi:hypothetical protein
MINDIKVDGPDVYSNHIWTYIIDKYVDRTKRMIRENIKPTFMFAGAQSAINKRSSFTIDEQRILNQINTSYDIYCSFGSMITFTNPHIKPIIQHAPYAGNTLNMANDLYKQYLQLQ